MSKEGPDGLFILTALVCIPLGAYLGGSIGYDEASYVGMVVGILAGGFAGLIATFILGIVVAFGLVAMMFLGPVALVVATIYYLFFRTDVL